MSLPALKISDKIRLSFSHGNTPVIEYCAPDKAWIPILRSPFLAPEVILKGGETLNLAMQAGVDPTKGDITSENQCECFHTTLAPISTSASDFHILHVRHNGTWKCKHKAEFIRQRWQVLQGPLSFTWTPHLVPRGDYVIGDHAFRSPAVVVATAHFAVAIVPDLSTYQQWPLPARQALHLHVSSPEHPLETGTSAEFWHGYCNYVPHKHVFFRHKAGSTFPLLPNKAFALEYDLLFFAGDNLGRGQVLRGVNRALWERFAHSRMAEFAPQVLPFEDYVRAVFPVPFTQHGAWREWTVSGQECGGTIVRSWMGWHKKKWHEIPPRLLESAIKANQRGFERLNAGLNEQFNFLFTHLKFVKFLDFMGRTLVRITRDVAIWNQAWFMNVRSAYGLYYFGESLSKPEWKKYALAMIRGLVFAPAPSNSPLDLFPAVALPSKEGVSWIEGTRAFLFTHYYGLYDCALAGYWLLKFHRECQAIPEIPPRVSVVIKSILSFQQPDGHFPSYVKVDGEVTTVDPILENSANCAAVLALLGEYYRFSRDKAVLDPAKRLAEFLIQHILPHNRWHDYESFYSCTHFPFDFYDPISQNHVNNTLCIHWAAEGLKDLYEATGEGRYLAAGLAVLQVLSLYQQVWSPPFLSADLFGGFASQNADAEWSDARQALFVSTYAEFYLHTRDPQLMERAIATLRACFAVAMIPENDKVAPGLFTGVRKITRPGNPDYGVVSENYGHQGLDFRTMGYVMFDWGAFSAGFAAAYMQKHFGDLFLDCKVQRAWGINGVIVTKADFDNAEIKLAIQVLPGKAALLVKGVDMPIDGTPVSINGKVHKEITPQCLQDGVWVQIVFTS